MLLFHKSPPAGADKLANVVNMSGNAKQMPALELEAFLEGEGAGYQSSQVLQLLCCARATVHCLSGKLLINIPETSAGHP